MSREFIESRFIDALRRKYPETKDLLRLAEHLELDLETRDSTINVCRDVITLILNELDFIDILRWSRVNKKFNAIVNSFKYNYYWLQRYRKDFYEYPPFTSLPNKALWVDLYQWTWCKQIRKIKYPLNKRTPTSFIKAKRNISSMPAIRMYDFNSMSVPKSVLSPELLQNIDFKNRWNCDKNNITINSLYYWFKRLFVRNDEHLRGVYNNMNQCYFRKFKDPLLLKLFDVYEQYKILSAQDENIDTERFEVVVTRLLILRYILPERWKEIKILPVKKVN